MSYLIVVLVPLLISLFLLALPDSVRKGVRYIYSLVVALILFQLIPLVDGSLLSYIIWAAILFGFYAVVVRQATPRTRFFPSDTIHRFFTEPVDFLFREDRRTEMENGPVFVI